MSPTASDLHLHEELLLIALRDDTGTPESQAGMIGFALGGALLAELALEGHVAIAPGKKALVELLSTRPLHDEVLDECVGLIRDAKRQRRASDWVSRFANLRRLRLRVADGLCRRGILQDSEATVLLLFKRKAFPTIDPEPERRLVERLRHAIESDDRIDARTSALVALVDRTRMLRIHFDKALLKKRKRRIERIAQGEMVAEAARKAVQAAVAAAQAAISVAMMAATTSARS